MKYKEEKKKLIKEYEKEKEKDWTIEEYIIANIWTLENYYDENLEIYNVNENKKTYLFKLNNKWEIILYEDYWLNENSSVIWKSKKLDLKVISD